MADDYTANTSTTGTVAVGGTATGNIETVGDNDWFKVQLTAGVTYQFDLRGTVGADDILQDPALWGILDSNGNFIKGTTGDDDGATLLAARVTFTPTASGTYYIDAGGTPKDQIRQNFPDFATGAYTLSVGVVDDYVADTGTTGRVAVGSPATGNIGPGDDRDWFKVELVAGKTYRFDLEGLPTGKGTLADPYLNGIYDSNGGFIGSTLQPGNYDGGTGNNARITFTPSETATYYISAGSDGSATNIGTYTVSVEEVL